MELDRRQLIKGGLAVLASGVVVPSRGWLSSGDVAQGARGQVVSARFPGDPGSGRLYYGASVMGSLSLPALEQALNGILTVRRSYYSASDPGGVVARAKSDHTAGRFPLISTKVPGTWASVASGAHDNWLLPLLQNLGHLTRPVMLCLHHEPEEEAGPSGMSPADWVRMQQHAISLARGAATNTTIVPILMQWTFDPHSGRRPQDWMVPECAVFGVNVYNPWAKGYPYPWEAMGPKLNMVLPYAGSKPIAIGEYGCRTDYSQPGRAAQWMRDAFAYCSQHNIIAMSYFDSNQHPHYGGWVLDQERTDAMRECRHKSNVALLP